jgi:hypothetical protein
MRKKKMQSLTLKKSVISNLSVEKAKGGVSGHCTSSVNPHECFFACPDSLYAPCN